jgi:hypothetical protein
VFAASHSFWVLKNGPFKIKKIILTNKESFSMKDEKIRLKQVSLKYSSINRYLLPKKMEIY